MIELLSQNFDSVVKIIIITFGAFGFYYALRNDISSLKKDMDHIKESQRLLSEAFKQLSGILTQIAVQDVRLSMIDKRLDEMTHGRGFINEKD